MTEAGSASPWKIDQPVRLKSGEPGIIVKKTGGGVFGVELNHPAWPGGVHFCSASELEVWEPRVGDPVEVLGYFKERFFGTVKIVEPAADSSYFIQGTTPSNPAWLTSLWCGVSSLRPAPSDDNGRELSEGDAVRIDGKQPGIVLQTCWGYYIVRTKPSILPFRRADLTAWKPTLRERVQLNCFPLAGPKHERTVGIIGAINPDRAHPYYVESPSEPTSALLPNWYRLSELLPADCEAPVEASTEEAASSPPAPTPARAPQWEIDQPVRLKTGEPGIINEVSKDYLGVHVLHSTWRPGGTYAFRASELEVWEPRDGEYVELWSGEDTYFGTVKEKHGSEGYLIDQGTICGAVRVALKSLMPALKKTPRAQPAFYGGEPVRIKSAPGTASIVKSLRSPNVYVVESEHGSCPYPGQCLEPWEPIRNERVLTTTAQLGVIGAYGARLGKYYVVPVDGKKTEGLPGRFALSELMPALTDSPRGAEPTLERLLHEQAAHNDKLRRLLASVVHHVRADEGSSLPLHGLCKLIEQEIGPIEGIDPCR